MAFNTKLTAQPQYRFLYDALSHYVQILQARAQAVSSAVHPSSFALSRPSHPRSRQAEPSNYENLADVHVPAPVPRVPSQPAPVPRVPSQPAVALPTSRAGPPLLPRRK